MRISTRFARRVLAVAVVVAAGPLVIDGAATAHAAAPHPKGAAAPTSSNVVLNLRTSGSPAVNTTVTLIANLSPAAAYGDVTLFDDGAMVSGGHDYRHRWTYTTDHMTAGMHHLAVAFTPSRDSGYAASQAAVDYDVAAAPLPVVVKSPVGAKSKDPQTVEVTIPKVKATRTVRPIHSVSPEPTRITRTTGANKGPLPYTGFDAARITFVGCAAVLLGMFLLGISRRRRDRPVPRHR